MIVDQNLNNNNQENDECSDYHQFENLAFFDSNYDFENSDNLNTTILTNTVNFVCRRCFKVFLFNNQFYNHLRIAKCDKFVKSIHGTQDLKTYLNSILNNDIVFISLMHFNVNFNKNIRTEYDFRE